MRLKILLLEAHAFGQMDFAEDFKCTTQGEIQSPYWNATHVTIHPTMIYYKQEGSLFHQSVVYISSEPGYNTPAVYSIMKKMVASIKRLLLGTTFILYWTDSTSSQH